jgi:hypothetical protein
MLTNLRYCQLGLLGLSLQVDYLLRRLMLLKERTDDTEDLVS